MLQKYNRFIFEKVVNDFILEGYLMASPDFLKRIKSMSEESGIVGDIAKTIYDNIINSTNYDDDDLKQNYFNLSDDNDKVTFSMHDKIDEYEVDDEYPYDQRRSEIKIGKLLKYLANLNDMTITNSDIENFVNVYKSKSKSKFKFKLVSGKDILKYYNRNSLVARKGILNDSCMMGKDKSTFKLYTENYDKVRLLIYVNDNDEIVGRALIWKLDKSLCDAKYFMDRIYTTYDYDVYQFIDYAKKNDFMYRFNNSNRFEDDEIKFIYKENTYLGIITVRLDGNFDTYPYLDTLSFLNKKKTKLSNVPTIGSYWLVKTDDDCDCEPCTTCGGTLFEKDGQMCTSCAAGLKILIKKGIVKLKKKST